MARSACRCLLGFLRCPNYIDILNTFSVFFDQSVIGVIPSMGGKTEHFCTHLRNTEKSLRKSCTQSHVRSFSGVITRHRKTLTVVGKVCWARALESMREFWGMWKFEQRFQAPNIKFQIFALLYRKQVWTSNFCTSRASNFKFQIFLLLHRKQV